MPTLPVLHLGWGQTTLTIGILMDGKVSGRMVTTDKMPGTAIKQS